MAQQIVIVHPAEALGRCRRLFEGLAEILPICFRAPAAGGSEPVAGQIFMGEFEKRALHGQTARVPTFAFSGPLKEGGLRRLREVRFAPREPLPDMLRGRGMEEAAALEVRGLVPLPGDTVLAADGPAILWLRRRLNGVPFDEVAVSPPDLGERGYLHSHFNGDQFMGLLPLLLFLRELCAGPAAWSPAPLRACIVVDDPSLRWGTYGCLNFRDVVLDARAHRYHVSIGAIPLDTGWSSASVCRLFRENPAQLSLCIHGHLHTRRELLRPCDDAERMRRMAAARDRMDRFARSKGISVSRVMEPPYAAIGAEYIPTLERCHYEGVMITPGRFVRCNPHSELPASFGLHCAEVFKDTLPMIPRLVFSSRTTTEVILAAVLGQPAVVATHHQDAAHGLEAFRAIAQRLNSVGPVNWCSPSDLLQSHYRTRLTGDRLSVEMASRHIRLPVPSAARRLQLSVAMAGLEAERGALKVGQDGRELVRLRVLKGATGDAVLPGSEESGVLEVDFHPSEADDGASLPGTGFHPAWGWATLRRTMMELRDRLYPWIHSGNALPILAGSGPSSEREAGREDLD